ncbi:hypothetical protein PQ469_10835 [Mucilaginibacter sp. KACC 22773]|jgi:hypothetical protein|uniref:hypothetical protein n=1 Tax=Mucilaginibacter sp. KACC 22773 TaxID=3025671 RepID=UPI00236659D6|nr:hypothetical protein [Mucilaginibacter sp. KACC 22773]WDF80501.1 hypothetical protein PQ469_10835 [Mucilaginibacter sp. KACC 22773]
MVTTKSTYYVMAVNLLYTLSVVISIILKFNDIPLTKWHLVLNEVVYIIPLIYLVMVLKYLKEDASIITTCKIFIGVDVFISLYFVVVKLRANNVSLYYLLFLLSIVVVIIFIIQSARIQNKWLAYPMLTYGLIFLFISLLQLAASIFYSSMIFKFVSLTEILIPGMTFYILFKIARYLAIDKGINEQII